MKRYDSFKDSGVEWIGEIPSHWNTIKLKHKGDVIIGLSYNPDDVVNDNEGTLVMRSSNVQNGKPTFDDNVYVKTEISDKLKTKEGDILICSRNGSRRLIGKNCLITKEIEGMTWGVFMTMYRSPYYKYLYWLLNSSIFKSQSGLFLTSTINQLTVSTLENMVLPFTENVNEQQQITSFLNTKTSLIDSLIEKTKQKSKLLKERLLVSVEEVLHNKNVKRERLKHVVDLVQRPIERTPTETFNKIGMFNWGRGIFKYPDELGLELGDSTFNYIKEKDLLLSGQFSWEGSVSIVQKEHNNCISSHRFHILNGHENKILNEYLWSYFISQEGHWMLNINSFGSGGRNRPLNIMRLLNEKIPVPNIKTQEKIRDFVFEYDFYKKYEEERIKLLKEYKQSLISEVVTGKKRVVS